MIKTRASTLVASPTDRVFEFIAVDFLKNYKRWSPEVVSLTPISTGPVRIGTTMRQVRIDQGRRTETTFKVCAFETGKRVDFKGITDPFYISYRLKDVADKTQLTFDFELSRLEFYMRPFEKLIRITVQEGAERVVRNIKGLIEAEGRAGAMG
jgi:hypothetical protein